MRLTLWLLNRCVDWETTHPGQMLDALVRAGHDVTLGQRCVGGDKDASECCQSAELGSTPLSRLAVNADTCSAPGALMHEGSPAPAAPSYDEYFVPIPVKCIGDPSFDGPAGIFWRALLVDGGDKERFARIVAGVDGQEPLHPCFQRGTVECYWPPSGARAPATPKGAWPFGGVRMNTSGRRGLYQILHDHTVATGRKNVLVGYSQGGTVARYLAYLDEVVARGPDCIHGVVTVQAPLRGSPLAVLENAEWVARAITTALLAITGTKERLEQSASDPAAVENARRLAAGRAVASLQGGGGTTVFSALAALFDAVIEANDSKSPGTVANVPGLPAERSQFLDVIRTARKWISGLSGEQGLAFRDLDCTRLAQDGSVLHAITTTPLQHTWHGAVVGTDYRLEQLARALVEQNFLLSAAEFLFRGTLIHRLASAETAFRQDVMDVAGGRPGRLAGDALQALHDDWVDPTDLPVAPHGPRIPPMAHDFVIPSASQAMPSDGGFFLGNHVNPDASHLSGARLETHPSDLALACAVLEKMRDP